MKHIFTVFSHITFYVAKSIIQSEKLSLKDCAFITGRNYRIPIKYQDDYTNVVNLSYGGFVSKMRYFAGANVFQTVKNTHSFDAMIDELVGGDDYYAYIAGWTDDIANLLVSKKNCKGYYIFEEGTGAYQTIDPKKFYGIRYWIYKLVLKNVFPRYYVIKESYFDIRYFKFKGFYAATQQSFPLFPQHPKKVVNVQFDTVDLGYIPDAIFSVDPLFGFISIDKVKDIYSSLAKYFAIKKYHNVAFKFHPIFEVEPEIKQSYLDLISNIFSESWIELDSSMVLENILYTYKCDFYSAGSSVQLYGAIAGAHCYTFTNLLHKYTSAYDNAAFKDFVEEIELEA